jgi:hypothetical protein
MTKTLSDRAVDCWLAALMFATAAVVGSAYVRVFDRSGARTPVDMRNFSARSMWFGQSEFGAAVALACGRGYVDPGYALTPGLSAFLTLKADRFSCAELPPILPPRAPNLTQRLYRYLMVAAAGVWAMGGVSWSGLWPLFGILYGATVAVCYGLFRFGMGRFLSCAAALAITVSAVHLGNLPSLRDYAKAPFILVLILIVGHLAKRVDRPRSMLALAALFGGTLGIGFGFRNDILIVVPVFLAVVLGWGLPRDVSAIGMRLVALAVAGATFAIASWPITSAYARGSNSSHVALMGLMPPFEQPLGIAGSVYEWGHVFRDEFAETLINSYTYRVQGHPVVYLSAEYDRAMLEYLLQIARHWPADIVTRAYGSVLKVVDLPFTAGVYVDPVPYGIHSATLLHVYDWQIRAIHVLEGTGVAVVALALLVISGSSIWCAAFLLAGLLYLAGYPAIQFQPRHFFHLEFVGWWALGFLAQRAIVAGTRIIRAWQTGRPLPTMSREAVQRVATFAAITIGIMALPLAGARLYQQRHMRTFLRAYVDAARETVPLQQIDAGDRTLLQTSTLWADRDPQQKINTQYIVAVFSPAICPAVRLPVTFRYEVAEEATDYSLDMTLTLGRNDPPAAVFFPAYHIRGASRFEGVEVPRGFEKCVQEVARVRDLRPIPLLLNLTLTADLERTALYQRLARWEPTGPASPLRVYALPQTLPVARATLHEEVTPPPVSWRTPIVQGDPPGSWRIIGTPRGPQWPAIEFSPEQRTPDDRFVLEGEVERGGITIGLVRGQSWTEDGNLTIATAGRFTAVLAPSAPGSYGVLLQNRLDDSWFLRHAPPPIAQLAGRFHAFNDVRIARAGWIQGRGRDRHAVAGDPHQFGQLSSGSKVHAGHDQD